MSMQSRKPRNNVAISSLTGIKAFLTSSDYANSRIKCVVWNVSTGGACLLINGLHEKLNPGDAIKLTISYPFDKMDSSWDCTIRWKSIETFVEFIGVAFAEADSARDLIFRPYLQD